MKIAILTQSCTYNYGGILQAWALQQTLKKLGHKGICIRPLKSRPPKLNWFYWKTYPSLIKRAIKIMLGKAEKGTEVFRYPLTISSKKTMKFVKRRINLRYFEDWKTAAKGMDALIIGSDQVWRRSYNYRPHEVNFGSFATGIPKIAYAASWGLDNSEYSFEENLIIKPLMRQLDAVSVREESGVKICTGIYGVNAEVVSDPTILIEDNEYRALIRHRNCPIIGKYVMTYFLDSDPRLTKLTELVAKLGDLEVYSGGSKIQDHSAPLIERIHPSVEEWLAGIDNCELLLTDSFHGTVFAIIFNRPFFVIGNLNRGLSRMQSLLKTFGLEDRLLNIEALPYTLDLNTPIDWGLINRIKADLQLKGENWLKNALNPSNS